MTDRELAEAAAKDSPFNIYDTPSSLDERFINRFTPERVLLYIEVAEAYRDRMDYEGLAPDSSLEQIEDTDGSNE